MRAAQKRLAAELTTLIHGADQTAAVELASSALFGRGELTGLDEGTLAAALGETQIAEYDAGAAPTIVELLVDSGLVAGSKAARRAIDEGGAYVNNVKVDSEEAILAASDALAGGHFVLRRGKKTVGILSVE